MFEDIYPPETDEKEVERRHNSSKVRHRLNINQQTPKKTTKKPMWSGDQVKQSSLSEQIKKVTDLRQLVKILEIAKVKVRHEKLKQRKLRKAKRQIKY
jgi:hypothetical protein